MVVGLTGGIGSGKSTVAKMFSKFENVAIYIADKEAKELMNSSEKIKTALIKEFGSEAYKDNKLNRPFLATIVFNNKEKLTILNSIVHPEVHKHLQNFIKNNSEKHYILYENAILFESNSNLFCDKIITVTAPTETKISRVLKRDNATREEVLSRMNNQWSDEKKLLQSHYQIINTSIQKTDLQVSIIHNYLTKNKQ